MTLFELWKEEEEDEYEDTEEDDDEDSNNGGERIGRGAGGKAAAKVVLNMSMSVTRGELEVKIGKLNKMRNIEYR